MDLTKAKWFHWVPTIGIVIFTSVFIYAAALYPGGTRFDSGTTGFDWFYNYLCDLFDVPAKNGEHNPVRPIAITGYAMICLGLSAFFYQFAMFFGRDSRSRRLIAANGIIGINLTLLTATPLHDVIIGVASIFGLTALYYMIMELRARNMFTHIYAAYVALGMILINNIIFYIYGAETNMLLPITQKLAFILVLGWVVWISHDIRRSLFVRT